MFSVWEVRCLILVRVLSGGHVLSVSTVLPDEYLDIR
jgi:hypothetical protein